MPLYTVALADAKIRGFKDKAAERHASDVVASVPIFIVGGDLGWQENWRSGKNVFTVTMKPEYLKRLNRGAIAYNENAANFNTKLRRRMNEVKSMKDPGEKRATYRAMLGESTKKASDLDERIENRRKALDNPGWSNSQEGTLKSGLNALVRYRDSLEKTNQELKKAYNSTVPL